MPGCDKCFGTGSVPSGKAHLGIPTTKPCQCTVAGDIVRNLNRGWPGLANAPKVNTTPLIEYPKDNAYITASDEVFRGHLRHVAIRMGWQWGFKVVSDSDLMTAWLSPASLLGKEILDPEAASVSAEKATLVDLVHPPELLIIRLGVKAARNSAMSEVFLEALLHRVQESRPTWVVDQPLRRLDPGHMCFSDEVIRTLASWDRVTLGENIPPGLRVESVSSVTGVPTPPQGLSFGATPSAPTRRIEMPEPLPSKKKFQKRSE